MNEESFRIDGKTYRVRIQRAAVQDVSATRLAVVGFQPNETAREILRLCIDCIKRFTPEPHELWVVDNCSPRRLCAWLADQSGLNVLYNRTRPAPPRSWTGKLFGRKETGPWASYANAVALELVARAIDPLSRRLMALHMDTMPCRENWLSFLQSKLEENAAAAGVRMDRARTPEGVLHILGCLVDFQLFREYGLDFFPDLPRYDVGDRLSVELRRRGHAIFACRNTHTEPELAETIPENSSLREFHVDRAFDDQGNVIFLHLGRGIVKSEGRGLAGKTSPEQWLELGRKMVLER